jgi:hypothetical protein
MPALGTIIRTKDSVFMELIPQYRRRNDKVINMQNDYKYGTHHKGRKQVMR